MSRTRTFIAVEVSDGVRGNAAELIEQLRQADAKVRWVTTDNMHVTLKFLGDQPDKRLGEICSAVQAAAQRVPAFHAQLQGAGAFPDAQRPRTVWLGVGQGLDEFRKLFNEVDHELGQIGIAKERRQYHPHLTIGRVRHGGPGQQQLATLIQDHEHFDAGGTIVSEVIVFGSVLEREGPIYTVLARAPLA